ncbi:TolB family protein [Streptomyces sp. LE64]|uniref:TolB family protein n=1 Tax=Streptomyces sp. LE64 TaxID=3448653 RepID=UPI0040413DDA
MKANTHTNRGTTRRLRTAMGSAVAVCAVATALPGVARAESTDVGVRASGIERVSVATDGAQSDGSSTDASITPDGSRIVFSSTATNLGDTPTTADGEEQDVFVWDRSNGTPAGPIEGPAKAATLVQLSDDGSKVVYLSGSDTHVHDTRSGTARTAVSAGGRAVVFHSTADDLVPGDTNGTSDLFVRSFR